MDSDHSNHTNNTNDGNDQASRKEQLEAKVGGVTYVLGGWAEYELSRRRALELDPYDGRSYVSNKELVEDHIFNQFFVRDIASTIIWIKLQCSTS